MEQKLKAQLYTEEKVFQESAEIPVDLDFMLPDYCPDAVKILKCRAAVHVSTQAVSGGTVSVEGTAAVSVLYADENNRVFAFSQPFPFAKTFETGLSSEEVVADCRARVEYMNCRAVTSRKIDIHGAIELLLCMTARKSVDILTDYDSDFLELRRDTVPATTPMGSAQKYVGIEDEITVGQGQPEICSLLRYDTEVAVTESKLLNGKNIVKGDLTLRMLYAPREGKPQTVRASLPFSQLIEVPGATDECTCDATARVAAMEIKPKNASSGECRSFSVGGKILICSKAYCDREVDVITDAYSRKCETELSAAEVEIHRMDHVLEETCRCRAVLEFPGGPNEVLDLCCEIQNASAVFGENDITVSGSVMAALLVCDDKGMPEYYEKPIPFSCKYPCDVAKTAFCEPCVTVKNATYSLEGEGKAEVRVDLCVRAAIMTTNRCRIVTDLQAYEDRPLPIEDRGAMTLYFAAAGESVWEIARHYRADIKEICALNGVGSRLTEDKMLMIPMT